MSEKSTLFRASKLSEEEIESARKLKERFDELKQRTGITKAAFAREFNFPGGASMISQHISGHRPISLDAAVVYMKGFGCTIADISPTLAAQLPKDKGQPDIAKKYQQASDVVKSVVDDLMNMPAADAAKLASIVASIRATYGSKS